MSRPMVRWLLPLLLFPAWAGAAPSPQVSAPPPFRYIVGGDARDDVSHVLPWAFAEAKKREAVAFFFLGDMELTPELDGHFERVVSKLDPIPFYPVIGNHEVKQLGRFPIERVELSRRFQRTFLGTPRTPAKSVLRDRVTYSVTLPGGLHFVALDNVTQKGFGAEQLAWLAADLEQARHDPAVRAIVVGMHEALANNGATHHSMDDEGDAGVTDSAAALTLLQKAHVDLIVASHEHGYWDFQQGGLHSIITGGLGAPLKTSAGKDHAFHHLLELDLTDGGLRVQVVRFNGPMSEEKGADSD